LFPMDYEKFLGKNGRVLKPSYLRSVFAVGLWILTLVVVRAQQAAPAPPAPKPLVPAAASSIAANPQQFLGQMVTVYATVERIVSPTLFTVDQDPRRSGIGEVEVLVPEWTTPPTPNAYVTVIGEMMLFNGRPTLRATTVLDAKLVDLAKKALPPLTPEEQAFDAVMKKVQPAFGALRTAVSESNVESTKAQTAILKQAFTDTEAFFRTRGKPDAQQWAMEARTHVEMLERAAAGKWDEAKAAVTALQQTCSSCHAVYRERQDDGSYRIRGDK
jgi:cytochrome c556